METNNKVYYYVFFFVIYCFWFEYSSAFHFQESCFCFSGNICDIPVWDVIYLFFYFMIYLYKSLRILCVYNVYRQNKTFILNEMKGRKLQSWIVMLRTWWGLKFSTNNTNKRTSPMKILSSKTNSEFFLWDLSSSFDSSHRFWKKSWKILFKRRLLS